MEHCIGTACTTVEIGNENYRTEIRSGNHVIIADEPIEIGGADTGMNPNLLLLASLGSCTAITLKMYAQRKKWNVEKITIDLSLDIVKSDLQQTSFIKRHISVTGDVSEKDRNRLLAIADQCPIHRLLTNPIQISTNLLPQD